MNVRTEGIKILEGKKLELKKTFSNILIIKKNLIRFLKPVQLWQKYSTLNPLLKPWKEKVAYGMLAL